MWVPPQWLLMVTVEFRGVGAIWRLRRGFCFGLRRRRRDWCHRIGLDRNQHTDHTYCSSRG
jgi:hypothetical protein